MCPGNRVCGLITENILCNDIKKQRHFAVETLKPRKHSARKAKDEEKLFKF